MIRPCRSLLATAFVSILLATSPVFAVLYWLSAEDEQLWIPVLVVHLALFFAGVGLFLRQLTVSTTLDGEELSGNGFLSPMVRVRLHDIAEVVLVDTHVGIQPEPVMQLLIRDADGRRLFRMRGNYWHQDDLEELVAALPIEATVLSKPMRLTEFFERYPGSSYWFEGRPWVTGLGVVALLAVVTVAVSWATILVNASSAG